MSRPVTCHYCNNNAELVTGREIYPTLVKLHQKKFWRCLPCKAWVGTHEASLDFKPLGLLAKKELRDLKMRAHAAFDPVWKDGKMKRAEAYAWLAEKMGLETKRCHIGWFNEEKCQKVIDVCRSHRGLT